MTEEYRYLNGINDPADLRKLDKLELLEVAKELRSFIIDAVSSNPGHFGASLGVVELTLALHYVYNTPYDKIVWDVGHQAYGHKIITGRRDRFHTNRRYGGLSGFPRMDESPYDSFGTGHSSTSISAALGLAIGSKMGGNERSIIAVIGDGSMTAGQAFEGMNNAGMANANLLVILNDNNISIDATAGALKEYLLDITTSKTYNRLKDDVWNTLGKIRKLGPKARTLVSQIESGIKSTILDQSNLFEGLNFRYFGPVDGHDLLHLTSVLDDMKRIPGPKLLHCITKKGKGFREAENDQTLWHSPGMFDKKTGKIYAVGNGNEAPLYQEVFGHTLLSLAKRNSKIVGITPAMPTGCSLNIMMKELPERTFDVGIAEQHAVTFSAGLAAEGMIPYCNIYSSFMQRSYDQVIHDVALQKLKVIFCLDRGGLVGSDGATHHGFFDIAYMRHIPDMIVAAPMDESDLRNMLYTAQLDTIKLPFSIRYPRGRGNSARCLREEFKEIPVGKGRLLREGKDIALLTLGLPGKFAAEAAKEAAMKGIEVAHYDMRFVAPLDGEILHSIFRSFGKIITVEDGILKGGFGSAVTEFMADNSYSAKIKRMGIPDYFAEHGTQEELYRECGFDTRAILETIISMTGTTTGRSRVRSSPDTKSHT